MKTPINKRIWGIFAVVAVSAIVALSLSWRARNLQESQLQGLREGPIVEGIYGLGTVVARKQFHYKVGVTKTVMRLLVDEGAAVERGQRILELSDGPPVVAPFAGTVTSLPSRAGETVSANSTVAVVEDLTDRYVQASLEQQGALRVKRGMSVKVSFESLRDQVFTGTVESIYPQDGQFTVRIEVSNLPKEILPGMTADCSILVAQKDKALLVPALAVQSGQVLRWRNGKKEKVSVGLGIQDGQWAEVTSGDLQSGDQVLVGSSLRKTGTSNN